MEYERVECDLISRKSTSIIPLSFGITLLSLISFSRSSLCVSIAICSLLLCLQFPSPPSHKHLPKPKPSSTICRKSSQKYPPHHRPPAKISRRILLLSTYSLHHPTHHPFNPISGNSASPSSLLSKTLSHRRLTRAPHARYGNRVALMQTHSSCAVTAVSSGTARVSHVMTGIAKSHGAGIIYGRRNRWYAVYS